MDPRLGLVRCGLARLVAGRRLAACLGRRGAGGLLLALLQQLGTLVQQVVEELVRVLVRARARGLGLGLGLGLG